MELQFLMYEALALKVVQQKDRLVYARTQFCGSVYKDCFINEFLVPARAEEGY